MTTSILDTLAHASGNMAVCNVPAGYEAGLVARATALRGGICVHVARDDAQASGFCAAARFFAPNLEILRLP
ncbi:MAG: hypothetical protein RLZZ157_558, partial [Pseudomonadota bacterium]